MKIFKYVLFIFFSIIIGILSTFFFIKGTSSTYTYLKNIEGNRIVFSAQALNSLENNLPKNNYSETNTIPENKNTALIFVGDIMLDRGVESSIVKNFNNDYNEFFQNLNFLKNSDILFGNLEGPVSDQGNKVGSIYSFRMPVEVLPALKTLGFDVLSVANNHAGDWNRAAFADNLFRIKKAGMISVGGGIAGKVIEPEIIEKNNLKIGFLALSDVGPIWLEAKEKTGGILLAKNKKMAEIIKNASEKVDYLVVSMHFGDEYKTTHNKRQEELAHLVIDSGANLVVGHHPHVIQDTEIYKDKIIAYSLGNFVFDQYFSPNTMEGMILEIELDNQGAVTKADKKIIKLNKQFQPAEITDAGSIL